MFFFLTLYGFGGLDPTENIYKREHTHFRSDEFETAVQVQLKFIKNCIDKIIAFKAFSIIGIDFENRFCLSTEIYSVLCNSKDNFFFLLLLLCYFKKIRLKFDIEIFAIYSSGLLKIIYFEISSLPINIVLGVY